MASICDNPYSIPSIDLDECIGTSLATINSNFQDLKESNCDTFDELNRIDNNLIELSAIASELSSYAPRFPKAWVYFNGTNEEIYSSFNVAQVSSLSTGVYALSFTVPFNDTNYALIGTCHETLTGSSAFYEKYVWVQPTTFTTTSANINIHNSDGHYANPAYVSIVIYNN